MNWIGIIPARYPSSRFPGKPLALIGGIPLIRRSVMQVLKAKSLSEVIVATDDERIRDCVGDLCAVEMTRPDHPSGTDRIAEVVRRYPCHGALNVQGDEPLIPPEVIDAVALALEKNPMSTAACRIEDPEEYGDPNVVKVVLNQQKRAMYFSRRCIPYYRADDGSEAPVAEAMAGFPYLKHLGIYGYRTEILERFVSWAVSPLEKAERLEQLRALDHGISIHVEVVNYQGIGVDTPADVAKVEKILAENGDLSEDGVTS